MDWAKKPRDSEAGVNGKSRSPLSLNYKRQRCRQSQVVARTLKSCGLGGMELPQNAVGQGGSAVCALEQPNLLLLLPSGLLPVSPIG